MAKYMYQKQVMHTGLNKVRVVKAASSYELKCKVNALEAQWDEQWKRQQARQEKFASEQAARTRAEELTRQAEREHLMMDRFLIDGIDHPLLTFDHIRTAYKPSISVPPLSLTKIPASPRASNPEYNPRPSLFTRIFKMKEHTALCQKLFEEAQQKWNEDVKSINAANEQRRQKHDRLLAELDAERQTYFQEIDSFQADFANGNSFAVERFSCLQLTEIKYPFPFETEVISQYVHSEHLMIVDLYLPVIDNLPDIKQVTYVKTRNALSEKHYSSADMHKKYNALTYQTLLLAIHRLFSSIPAHLLDTLILNGRVHTIDKSNGHPIEPYIFSVKTSRAEFTALNLYQIDPVMWFKHAKGLSAASLADITPIAPIAQALADDKRFVDGYSVTPDLHESTNLASMDWMDFENLIREIFAQEFSQNGGEVHITQASRDGGVDAIAFDPDPIKGGKIVIQAKRYTNVVGVSAVRDLFGTVMNEGAMKGILVTTSNYGKDAYDFAAGKPLTLLSGSELLYLLEKHGHKAHIDIAAAKAQRS